MTVEVRERRGGGALKKFWFFNIQTLLTSCMCMCTCVCVCALLKSRGPTLAAATPAQLNHDDHCSGPDRPHEALQADYWWRLLKAGRQPGELIQKTR